MAAIAGGAKDLFTRVSAKQISKELLRRHYLEEPKLYRYWFRKVQLREVRRGRKKRISFVVFHRKNYQRALPEWFDNTMVRNRQEGQRDEGFNEFLDSINKYKNISAN